MGRRIRGAVVAGMGAAVLMAGCTGKAGPPGPSAAVLTAALPGPGDVPAGWTPVRTAGARFVHPAYRGAGATTRDEFTAPDLGGGPVSFTLLAEGSAGASASELASLNDDNAPYIRFPGADQATSLVSCGGDRCTSELVLSVGSAVALVSAESRHPLRTSALHDAAVMQVTRLREAIAGRRSTATAR